jgi:hypothetical protein
MMEAVRFSDTSVLSRAIRRHIRKDDIHNILLNFLLSASIIRLKRIGEKEQR